MRRPACAMLVFIDESGCRGFKLVRGSDPVFAIAMVVFRTAFDAARTEEMIRSMHVSLSHRSEFKFSKCRDSVRDGFFQGLTGSPFSVRAAVARTQLITSGELRADAEAFYRFFVMHAIKSGNSAFTNASIRMDGRGDREFQRALSGYMRRELRGRVREVTLKDSARDPLIQLADMCAGAIARAYRDRSRPDRWLKLLRPRIDAIWEHK